MSARQRREREKVETRRKILDAARELFALDGYDAVTMRAIADRIEYTPTAIYFHFRDKGELIERLCVDDFAALGARFQVLARVADPLERIRLLARTFVSFAVEHPHHSRLMYLAPRPKRPASIPNAAAPASSTGPTEAFLLGAVSEAANAGRFRRDAPNPERIASAIGAGMHGVAALAIAERTEERTAGESAEERLETVVGALLRGLQRDEHERRGTATIPA
jgi:AcrR family transcriptional regulator